MQHSAVAFAPSLALSVRSSHPSVCHHGTTSFNSHAMDKALGVQSHPSVCHYRTTSFKSHAVDNVILDSLQAAQDLVSDDTLAMEAFEWCSNLGGPSALVAGAVLATLSQTRGDLAPCRSDPQWVRISKKLCRALLLSSFAMEIVCIFVTTVTGTMLLSHGDSPAGWHAGIHYHSAMGFLNHNHEFEYLTSRVTFLQGLLHWLAAVALEVIIPKQGEGAAAKKMNQFICSSLVAIILMIISFYNGHMTFYNNYAEMLCRYTLVTLRRFFVRWPVRPMSVLSGPAFMVAGVLGWRAFHAPPDDGARRRNMTRIRNCV